MIISLDWKVLGFHDELADDVVLTSSIFQLGMTGRSEVRRCIAATFSQMTNLKSYSQVPLAGRSSISYCAMLDDGQNVETTAIISRNDNGEISNIIIHHAPYAAAEAMVSKLVRHASSVTTKPRKSWIDTVLLYADWISR